MTKGILPTGTHEARAFGGRQRLGLHGPRTQIRLHSPRVRVNRVLFSTESVF